jgi:MarR family transcriptional regulator, organic hydroperoxide resistance regulator
VEKIVLDDAVGFIVFQAHQAMRQAMYRVFRERGAELTPEQWVVLVRLWERDGRTQSELCEATMRDRPTMSRMLDGMAERGWIERRLDPADGRNRTVHLTREGRALEGKLVPLVKQRLWPQILDGIDAAELATTLRCLRRMTKNLAGSI